MSDAALAVAAVQTENVLGAPDANLARVEPLVRSAAERGARLIVLPELLPSGYAPDHRPDLAAEDLDDGPTVTTFGRWGRQLPGHPVLVTTVLERGAPAAFGAARTHAWDMLTRSRALENRCVLIAAGYCGSTAGRAFAGHSRIVDPAGLHWRR